MRFLWNLLIDLIEDYRKERRGVKYPGAKLNLGSYLFPIEGYHNVDILKWKGVDEVVDLNQIPWPWKDGTFDHVRAVDIVEHLGKLTKLEIIGEIARVTRPGGTVLIRVPCENHPWAWSSLQHAHAFQYNSFEPSFDSEAVFVQFTDGGRSFRLTPLTRTLCKYTRLIHTLEFHLRRK